MNNTQPNIFNYKKPRRKLVAWSALLIFFAYLGSQLLSGVIGGIVISLSSGITEQSALEELIKQNTVSLIIFSLAFSTAVMLALSFIFCRGLFFDRTVTGIALHKGTNSQIFAGISLGLLVSVTYVLVASYFFSPESEVSVGPLTEMLLKPGKTRIAWILFALFFAPPVEEFLFRGVIFAGISYSRGIIASAVITSILFTVIHAFEAIHYPPAFIGIGLIAVVTMVLRIKYKALGPSIAAHFGYNLIIAAGALAAPVQ